MLPIREAQDCGSCQRGLAPLETESLNLAELTTQEETTPDVFGDAQDNTVVTSGQGSQQLGFGHTHSTACYVQVWQPQQLLFPLLMLCVSAAVS